jgi:hypothetical protein
MTKPIGPVTPSDLSDVVDIPVTPSDFDTTRSKDLIDHKARERRLRELEAGVKSGRFRPRSRRPTGLTADQREQRRARQRERRAIAAGLVQKKDTGFFWFWAPVKFSCQQCGAEFKPQRTTARFCSTKCRVYWNRAKGK